MIKKDKYNVCLIGALAQISPLHVEGIKSISQFNLSAVCDIDRKKLRERYPRLPENSLFTDYRQAIQSEDIDIVIIAAPNKLHAIIAIEALRNGKIVLCEKPMTHSMESAKQLYDEVKSNLGFFCVSYHFRFRPEVQKFVEIRDTFGIIKSFHFVSSEDLETEKTWILDKTQGGPWLDWASNALSVLRPVLSVNDSIKNYSIKEVKYVHSNDYEIELKADIDLTINNIEGNISVDWLSPKGCFNAKTELVNELGDVIVLNHDTCQILFNGELYWTGMNRSYIAVYKDFLRRLNSRNTNIHIGLQDAQIIQAVRNYNNSFSI